MKRFRLMLVFPVSTKFDIEEVIVTVIFPLQDKRLWKRVIYDYVHYLEKVEGKLLFDK